MTYIIWPEEAANFQDQLGGKAAALAALRRAGFSVPAWFLISPQAFYDSLTPGQQESLQTGGGRGQAIEMFDTITLNPLIQAELASALARFCPEEELVAVRSSAIEEDGIRSSFAGQFDSFLNVSPWQIADFVIRVWRSGYSDRVRAYGLHRGLDVTGSPPAVLIQRMVKAQKSGVAFSADPVSGRRDLAVIEAVNGLCAALVSGQVDADTYRVDRFGQITERIPGAVPPNWQNGHRPAPGMNGSSRQPETGNQPVLNDEEIWAVAQLARQAELFFDQPQDIEWAFEGRKLLVLQSRPVTTLPVCDKPATVVDQDEPIQVWDNSNIAESYPGVTSPLTFSFVRRAYEAVYRQFCYLMGVPDRTINAEAATYRRMLGLIQGRVYYNLASWYRVLSLLPGYRLNRGFMEQMMGVKHGLPDYLQPGPATAGRRARLIDSLYVLRTVASLVINFARLPRLVPTFYQRLNNALAENSAELSAYSTTELVDYYRRLEGQLLTRWDAPLVNDFFTMIFYGTLRKLTQNWCGDETGSLQHQLLANTGVIVSVEPVARIREMAGVAAADETLIKLLCEDQLVEIRDLLPRWPEFHNRFQAYLQKFGDRCLEELKLESPTLHDNPLPLLRTTGQLARQRRENLELVPPGSAGNRRHPVDAGRIARQALAGQPLRRLIFFWVLKNTRILIRNRENLRFERTRLFGRARLIFVELGRRFHAAGLIGDSRDIFYLEVEEIMGAVDHTNTTADLSGLVAVRKSEFDTFRRMPSPSNRFETRGLVVNHQKNVITPAGNRSENPPVDGQERQGLGCSPGMARGPVRVIVNPRGAALKPGEILVAQHTDPGWIILFSGAAGVLVEHGGLLSHAAIVSRELGLPAVVSLTGATHWLKDGDWVEFDGSTGLVTKVETPLPTPI